MSTANAGQARTATGVKKQKAQKPRNRRAGKSTEEADEKENLYQEEDAEEEEEQDVVEPSLGGDLQGAPMEDDLRHEAALARCEADLAKTELRQHLAELAEWRGRAEAAETASEAQLLLQAREAEQARCVAGDADAALDAARGALEALRTGNEARLSIVRAETEAELISMRLEVTGLKKKVNDANDRRDVAEKKADSQIAADLKQQERKKQQEHEESSMLRQYQFDADTASFSREAAAAACAAAVHLSRLADDAASKALTTRDKTRAEAKSAMKELKEKSSKAVEEAQGRAREAELSSRRDADSREASVAACAAASAESFRSAEELASSAEERLVSREERDSARARAKALGNKVDELTVMVERAESGLESASTSLTEERTRRTTAESEAATLLAARGRLQEDRDGLSREHGVIKTRLDQVEQLSVALQKELERRLEELTKTKKELKESENEKVEQQAAFASTKRLNDDAASEREQEHSLLRQRSSYDQEQLKLRVMELERGKQKSLAGEEAKMAAHAALEAQLEDAARDLKEGVAREERSVAALRELGRETDRAKRERDEARENLEQVKLQNSGAAQAVQSDIAVMRKEMAKTTRVAAQQVAEFQRASSNSVSGHAAADAACSAARLLIAKMEKEVARSRRKTMAAMESAEEYRAEADSAASQMVTGFRVSNTLAHAGEARLAAGRFVAQADVSVARMRAAVAMADAREACENAEEAAEATREEAETAVAAAKRDREESQVALKKARDAHALVNDALRKNAESLAREKEYAAKLERQGFDELVTLRSTSTDLVKRLKQAEKTAADSRTELDESTRLGSEARASATQMIAQLTARMRAAERALQSERGASDATNGTLRLQAEQAERDAAKAIGAMQQSERQLRLELDSSRAAVYSARSASDSLQNQMDDLTLQAEASEAELSDLRRRLSKAEQRAKVALASESSLHDELHCLRISSNAPTKKKKQETVNNEPTELDQLRRRLRGCPREEEEEQAISPIVALVGDLQEKKKQAALLPKKTEEEMEMEAHLARAAQARSNGLIDSDDDADPEDDPEGRLRLLEEQAFTTKPEEPQTTKAIAAAAMYLEKRRQRDSERELLNAPSQEQEDDGSEEEEQTPSLPRSASSSRSWTPTTTMKQRNPRGAAAASVYGAPVSKQQRKLPRLVANNTGPSSARDSASSAASSGRSSR